MLRKAAASVRKAARIELSAVEFLKQRKGGIDAHVEPQQRIEGVDARDQVREAGARDVVVDADGQPPFDRLRTGERAIVRGEQIARTRE
jgi:hypothetical protein